jgi:hypothetical protein
LGSLNAEYQEWGIGRFTNREGFKIKTWRGMLREEGMKGQGGGLRVGRVVGAESCIK